MTYLIPLFAATIANAADLRQAAWSEIRVGDTFSVTCTVTAATSANKSFWAMDDSGYCYLRTDSLSSLPKPGSLVRVDGHIGIDKYNWQRAFADTVTTIGEGRVPEPVRITADQLDDESFDDHTVVMSGIVSNIMDDDIDPAWKFISLRSERGPFLAAISPGPGQSLDHLAGAEVSVTGVAEVLPDGGRRKFKPAQLTVSSADDIKIVEPAPQDPFQVPRLHDGAGAANFQYRSAEAISRMGCRSAEGVVTAAFGGGRNILIKTGHGQLVGAMLKNGPAPAFGESVIVAGFPETDLFILCLANATWKRTGAKTSPDLGPATELPDRFDMDMVLREMTGRIIRVTGKVADEDPGNGTGHGVFRLSCGGRTVPVDASSIADDTGRLAPPGSIVEATGVCVLATKSWNPSDIFPKIDGFTVVPRDASDIRIVRHPPWLTPGRLLAVTAILLVALAGTLVWIRVLNRLVERRGRQLIKAEIAKAESDLRVDERTRLAADLHDLIAQTLTGVSFQIDAAAKTLRRDADAASRFLEVARRTLLSCREELRRCLWDLRSLALEEPDMKQAVEKTVRPHTEGLEVTVRFDVRRAQLSDTTAHNVLSIIRELCANAVRHGRARHIAVTGGMTDGILRFSVEDDGAGFDPETRPGPAQGHFGLQGIKERVKRMHGTLRIESWPGRGTKAEVEVGR